MATAVLQVENTCGDHSTEEQVQELKHLLVKHMEQTGIVLTSVWVLLCFCLCVSLDCDKDSPVLTSTTSTTTISEHGTEGKYV